MEACASASVSSISSARIVATFALGQASTGEAEHYQAVVTGKSGKHYLIFDPTDPYTPLGDLRGRPAR